MVLQGDQVGAEGSRALEYLYLLVPVLQTAWRRNNLTNEMNGFGVNLFGRFFFPKLLNIQDENTDTC